MNKRIRELEAQCWEPRQYGPAWFTRFNSEKFALLIVRECARVSERTGALNEADYEGEMIADAIKEHFGVQE